MLPVAVVQPASASPGSRVRRCTVSAPVVEDPPVAGSRSRTPITTRSGWWGSGWSYSSRTVSSGSSTRDGAGADEHHVALRRAAGGCRPRGPSRLTQRLVPSAAALRPSSVVANFQVTNGRRCSTRERPGPVQRARLALHQPEPDLDPGGAQGGRTAGGDRVGVGLGEHDAARRRPRSAPAAHGPVRPVWLQGSRVTTAVAPRAPVAGLGQAQRPRRAGCRRRGGSPRRPRRRRRRAGRSRRAGSARGVRRACARARAREHRALLGGGERHRRPFSSVRSRTRGTEAGRRRTTRTRATTPACSSHPDFDRRSRSSTWSTGCWLQPGRGLSPPARNCTDPRARELENSSGSSLPHPRAGGDVRQPTRDSAWAVRRGPAGRPRTGAARRRRRPA